MRKNVAGGRRNGLRLRDEKDANVLLRRPDFRAGLVFSRVEGEEGERLRGGMAAAVESSSTLSPTRWPLIGVD